jgi:hypothetical protein
MNWVVKVWLFIVGSVLIYIWCRLQNGKIERFQSSTINSIAGYLKRKIEFNETVERTIGDKTDTFLSGSPSIIDYNDGYLMNVRYVNYTFNKETGAGQSRHANWKNISINKALVLNNNFESVQEHWIDQVQNADKSLVGVEDIKLFKHNDTIRYLGTVMDDNNKIRIGEGEYSLSTKVLTPQIYNSPNNEATEKNWVYFNHNGELKVIYKRFPITIGVLKNGNFEQDKQINDVPDIFKKLRGSANGYTVAKDDGAEIWFLTHYADGTVSRSYYHCIVVLDGNNLSVKRHSKAFKFEGERIEFALGLIVKPDQVLMSYSKWDTETMLGVYDRSRLEIELFDSGEKTQSQELKSDTKSDTDTSEYIVYL